MKEPHDEGPASHIDPGSCGNTQSAVSAADLAALDSFAAANAISLANLPEPTSVGVIVMVGWGMIWRRRRSSRYTRAKSLSRHNTR